MVVWRYFYINIDPIARQMVASRMMKFTARFPQQFATTAWKANFTFLPSDIQLIQKKNGIVQPRGPHHFRLGMSKIFNSWIWRRLK
jgi:hypothetical protein